MIGKLLTTTGAGGLNVDLSASTFFYQRNAKGAASASPFLAVQGAGGIHDFANYDVIWVGTVLAKGSAEVDVSAALGSNGASVTFAGGTLDFPDSSNGANRAFITTVTGDARFQTNTGSANLPGATSITGTGGFLKSGSRTLNLQASCDYLGATEIL